MSVLLGVSAHGQPTGLLGEMISCRTVGSSGFWEGCGTVGLNTSLKTRLKCRVRIRQRRCPSS